MTRPSESSGVCAHDGCFRPVQEATGYCCDTCNDADGDGLPPRHEKGCKSSMWLRGDHVW